MTEWFVFADETDVQVPKLNDDKITTFVLQRGFILMPDSERNRLFHESSQDLHAPQLGHFTTIYWLIE